MCTNLTVFVMKTEGVWCKEGKELIFEIGKGLMSITELTNKTSLLVIRKPKTA